MINLKTKLRFIKQSTRAFTLIELLVVIAIIGILSTLVIVALGNPRTSARDAKRLNDLKAMANALELYFADNNEYPSSLTPGDPLEEGGVVYMNKVPTNPTPRTDGICPDSEYTYTAIAHKPGHYQFSGCIGSSSGSFTAGPVSYQTDSGIINCGGQITDADGNIYNTVQIGSQCWMKEHLNTKIKPDGTCINGGGNPPCPTASASDNGLGRSCYNNSEAICTTDGSLYTWAGAMDGSTTPGAQGICPTGWRIPTDAEQNTLDQHLTDAGQTCDALRSGTHDCSAAGTKLKIGGTSGFDSVLAGYRNTDGSSFLNRSVHAYLWSSSPSGSSAWFRRLDSSEVMVRRNASSKAYGFSVRCLKN